MSLEAPLLEAPLLEALLLEALRPRSVRERLIFLVSGGQTAAQVYDRLPAPKQEALAPDAKNPEVRRRVGVAQVHSGLNALSAAGKVTRKRSSFGVMLASKGHRKVLVDVYR